MSILICSLGDNDFSATVYSTLDIYSGGWNRHSIDIVWKMGLEDVRHNLASEEFWLRIHARQT